MTIGNDEKEMDTFFLAFSGQNVAISTSTVHTVSHEINGTIITESKPVYFEGILLDYDNDYYYIGKTPTEISASIAKSAVISIEILEEKEILNSFLAHIPGPTNDSEIN